MKEQRREAGESGYPPPRERVEYGPKWADSVEVTKLDNGIIKIKFREKDRQEVSSKS